MPSSDILARALAFRMRNSAAVYPDTVLVYGNPADSTDDDAGPVQTPDPNPTLLTCQVKRLSSMTGSETLETRFGVPMGETDVVILSPTNPGVATANIVIEHTENFATPLAPPSIYLSLAPAMPPSGTVVDWTTPARLRG